MRSSRCPAHTSSHCSMPCQQSDPATCCATWISFVNITWKCVCLHTYCLNALSPWLSQLHTYCPDWDNCDNYEDAGATMECEDCEAPGAQSGVGNMDAVGDAQNLGENSPQGDCTGSEEGDSWSSPDEKAFEDVVRSESDIVCMCTPYCGCYRKLSNEEYPCTHALMMMDPLTVQNYNYVCRLCHVR